jgi:hypothetical protein
MKARQSKENIKRLSKPKEPISLTCCLEILRTDPIEPSILKEFG